MARESSRGRKVADLIQRELAILIQREIKDPRIGMVTVNEVTVSRDLAFADVYFTVLPAENTREVEDTLNQASGFMRSYLSKILSTRITPRLRFHYDTTLDTGGYMDKAIDRALAEDRVRHVDDDREDGDFSEEENG